MITEAAPPEVWIPPARLTERVEQEVHVLLWQIRGSTDLRVEGLAEELCAGNAAWIPAGVRHEFTVRVNSVAAPLFFDREAFATTLGEPTVVSVGRDLHALLLAQLVASSSQITPATNIARQVLALVESSPMAPGGLPMPTSAEAHRVAETLRLDPGDGRSVGALAASAHTSVRTLERAFRAETGMTLREWRIRNRMEAAAVLLRAETSVNAVAHRVGYTHVNAFRSVFKEHFGLTPTRYVSRYGGR